MVAARIKTLIITVFFLTTLGNQFASSQGKSVINENSINNWREVSEKGANISASGKYVSYFVKSSSGSIHVLQMVGDNKKRLVLNGKFFSDAIFINDDYLVFQRRDSLFNIALPLFKVNFLASGVSYLKYVDGHSIKFREKSGEGKFQTVLLDLKTGKRKIIKKVTGNQAVLKTDDRGLNSVWLNKDGQSDLICDDSKLQQEQQLKILSVDGITPTGTIRLTLTDLPQKQENRILQTKAKLTIWNYMDWQGQYLEENKKIDPPLRYAAIIVPSQKKIIQLEDRQYQGNKINEDTWLIGRREPAGRKYIYGPKPPQDDKFYCLISEKNGLKIPLDKLDSISNKSNIYLTKDQNFIVYFDTEHGDLHSYDVRRKVTVNLTGQTGHFKKENDDGFSRYISPFLKYRPLGIFTVLEDGDLIAKDEYEDLWRLDPSGKKEPTCVTGHYAQKNKVRFLGMVGKGLAGGSKGRTIMEGYDLFEKTKSLFEISLNNPSIPRKTIIEDTRYSNLIKAPNANVWLYLKSSASEPPNWFVTNGRTTTQISDVHPERAYNWMTAELMNWKTTNGVEVQGILYKPENLDSSRKYPVIINYYGEKSAMINSFSQPALMHCGDINVPWMVSRGYIVFVPDMKYRVGERGPSALECLESGVDEIIKRPYVDRDRMGLNGHSHGGWQTAYFVTHSNRYRAASFGAGGSDYISRSGDLQPNNNTFRAGSPNNFIERDQPNVLKSLWDRPDWYIQNSPVFYADKVTTPILMMHNRDDQAVAFSQGAEFFLALSRLGKPVWLLQYDKEGHLLDNVENRRDLTTRTVQFFDHYLKGAPAPLWMLDGIIYKDRDYKTGYELDTLGRIPGESPLMTEAEKKRIDEYSKIPLSEKLKRIKD